ncbi:MAG: hypothetical protein V3R60_05190 [Acidobacteriota bacterium]
MVADLRVYFKSAHPLRLGSSLPFGTDRGARELASVHRETCGEGWVRIGAARAFLDPIYSSGLFLALASAELAAGCVHQEPVADDVSAARLGAFEEKISAGVNVIRRLNHAFL